MLSAKSPSSGIDSTATPRSARLASTIGDTARTTTRDRRPRTSVTPRVHALARSRRSDRPAARRRRRTARRRRRSRDRTRSRRRRRAAAAAPTARASLSRASHASSAAGPVPIAATSSLDSDELHGLVAEPLDRAQDQVEPDGELAVGVVAQAGLEARQDHAGRDQSRRSRRARAPRATIATTSLRAQPQPQLGGGGAAHRRGGSRTCRRSARIDAGRVSPARRRSRDHRALPAADQRVHRMARRRQHDALELGAAGDDELAVRERHPRRVRGDLVLHRGVQRRARRLVGRGLRVEQQRVDVGVAIERDVLRALLGVRVVAVEQHVEEVVGIAGVADPAEHARSCSPRLRSRRGARDTAAAPARCACRPARATPAGTARRARAAAGTGAASTARTACRRASDRTRRRRSPRRAASSRATGS